MLCIRFFLFCTAILYHRHFNNLIFNYSYLVLKRKTLKVNMSLKNYCFKQLDKMCVRPTNIQFYDYVYAFKTKVSSTFVYRSIQLSNTKWIYTRCSTFSKRFCFLLCIAFINTKWLTVSPRKFCDAFTWITLSKLRIGTILNGGVNIVSKQNRFVCIVYILFYYLLSLVWNTVRLTDILLLLLFFFLRFLFEFRSHM